LAVAPLEVDAVAVAQTRRADGGEVPLLRAEDEDVSHRSPPPRCARAGNGTGRRISVTPVLEARTDVIGSLLRPAELLDAQEKHEHGEISEAELERAEDRAVD